MCIRDSTTGARQTAADAAAAYAVRAGWQTGIAIVDLRTGQITTAGAATTHFPAESTIKLLLAAHLLAAGEMTGDVAAAAHAMVAVSYTHLDVYKRQAPPVPPETTATP